MMLGKLFPEAARCFLKKPATVPYPLERLPIPAGFRGAPVVREEACIGCRICARQCPAKAIEMVETGEKTPRPAFHYDICIFCAVCAEICPKKAIEITQDFELASSDRASLIRQPGKAGDAA